MERHSPCLRILSNIYQEFLSFLCFYFIIPSIASLRCRSTNFVSYHHNSSISSPSTNGIHECTSAAVISITNLTLSAYSRYNPAKYSIVLFGCWNRNFRFSANHSKYPASLPSRPSSALHIRPHISYIFRTLSSPIS